MIWAPVPPKPMPEKKRGSAAGKGTCAFLRHEKALSEKSAWLSGTEGVTSLGTDNRTMPTVVYHGFNSRITLRRAKVNSLMFHNAPLMTSASLAWAMSSEKHIMDR